jgi:hypothetical protein
MAFAFGLPSVRHRRKSVPRRQSVRDACVMIDHVPQPPIDWPVTITRFASK